MKQKRAYQYRCYPTPSQSHILARTFGCARFIYNWGLRLRTDAYRKRGEHVYYGGTSAALTRLKQLPEYHWLHEVSCVPPQQALRHLDKAFKHFFDGRAKYPAFILVETCLGIQAEEAAPPFFLMTGLFSNDPLHAGGHAAALNQARVEPPLYGTVGCGSQVSWGVERQGAVDGPRPLT